MTAGTRDPYEGTRPDPSENDPGRAGGEGGSTEDGSAEGPARGLRARDRRIVQVIALVTVLPALLVLHWVDDVHNVRKNLEPPVKATTVARGASGTLGGAEWRLQQRQAMPGPGPDAASLRLVLNVRPLDAAGVKLLGSYGLTYRLRDGDGHEWSAAGLALGTPRVGAWARVTVSASVPRSRTGSVALEVRPPAYQRTKGALPSLRFAP